MIRCPLCGAANLPLAVTCAECRAYLQAKVDVLSPVPYMILTGIEILAAAWSWVLLARGVAIANGVSGWRAVIWTAGLALLTAGALAPVLFR